MTKHRVITRIACHTQLEEEWGNGQPDEGLVSWGILLALMSVRSAEWPNVTPFQVDLRFHKRHSQALPVIHTDGKPHLIPSHPHKLSGKHSPLWRRGRLQQSWNCSVGVATKLQARRLRYLGSIPLSVPSLYYMLWGPQSFVIDGYRGSLSGSKVAWSLRWPTLN